MFLKVEVRCQKTHHVGVPFELLTFVRYLTSLFFDINSQLNWWPTSNVPVVTQEEIVLSFNSVPGMRQKKISNLVVLQGAFLSHNHRVPSSTLISGYISAYSLCSVLHVLPVSVLVSSRFSGFHTSPKVMHIGGLAMKKTIAPRCECVSLMFVCLVPCDGLAFHSGCISASCRVPMILIQ